MAKELSLGKPSDAAVGGLAPERAAAVLETAHDYVNYRRAIGRRDVADPSALARDLLVARSRVDAPTQAPAMAPPTAPEQGHGSARASAGIGKRAGQRFEEIGLRPVYQDIVDPDEGYVRGAQIEFFNLGLRHYENAGSRVERLIPIDIFSLAPRDEFFQPRSWHISAGWQRMVLRDGSEPLVTNVIGGAGGGWSLGKSTLAYATADAGARIHHDLDKGYGVGAGGRAGVLFDATGAWRIHAYAQGIDYFAGEHDTPYALGVQQRLALGKDIAARFDLTRKRESGRDLNEASLSLMLYF